MSKPLQVIPGHELVLQEEWKERGRMRGMGGFAWPCGAWVGAQVLTLLIS